MSVLYRKIKVDKTKINESEITRFLRLVKDKPYLEFEINSENHEETYNIEFSIRQIKEILKNTFPDIDSPFVDDLDHLYPKITRLAVKYKRCWAVEMKNTPVKFKEKFNDEISEYLKNEQLLSSTFSVYVPNTNIKNILYHLGLEDFEIYTLNYKGRFSVYLAYLLADVVKKLPLIQLLAYILKEVQNSVKYEGEPAISEFLILIKYLISNYTELPPLHFIDVIFNIPRKLPKTLLISILINFMCKPNNLRCFSEVGGRFLVGDIDTTVICNIKSSEEVGKYQSNIEKENRICLARKGKMVTYCEKYIQNGKEMQLPILYKRKNNSLLRFSSENKIMIASGIGVAAFLNFIKEKSLDLNQNKYNESINVLFYALKNEEDDLTNTIHCTYKHLHWKNQNVYIDPKKGTNTDESVFKITENTIIFIDCKKYRLENVLVKLKAPINYPIYICGSHKMQRMVYPTVKHFKTIYIDRWD